MKNIKNKAKGITLIALVITIVILIILSTVTINTVFGDNGLIAKAQYASFLNEMNSVKEKVDMYKKFGFVDCGMAHSTWGGEDWHEMKYML